MISLCEQCRSYNWRKMQTIIDAYKDAGLDRPNHIWCQVRNRPEDLKFHSCHDFDDMNVPKEPTRGSQSRQKPRYTNYPNKLSSSLKTSLRKDYRR